MVIGSLQILVHLCVILVPSIRLHFMSARMATPLTSYEKIFLRQSSLGDWFLLYQIGKNMNKIFFARFLDKLSKAHCSDLETKRNDLEAGMATPLIELK